jgi:hypothetical protein
VLRVHLLGVLFAFVALYLMLSRREVTFASDRQGWTATRLVE